MSIHKDLSELVNAGLITQEEGDRISRYYQQKKGQTPNRLIVVFGILGAILVGLGLLLIIAHNWDELTRRVKTVVAFLPLVVGQLCCGYVLLKKRESVAWREGGATFLFFAVGASLSLVSQIYNIQGELSHFLLIWMMLCLPLVYLIRSSVASLLYISGITLYAADAAYWSFPAVSAIGYWPLFLAILPYYYWLCCNRSESNFTVFHSWLLPLSLTAALGTLANSYGILNYIAYFSLFGLFYSLGSMKPFVQLRYINNGYKVLGAIGTLVMLLMLSFDGYWIRLANSKLVFGELVYSAEFVVSVLFTLGAACLFYLQQKGRTVTQTDPVSAAFLFFVAVFTLGLMSTFSVVLINVYVLVIGLFFIKEGARRARLGILNLGLLVISALAACRFFDAEITFILRGLLFVLVGSGFFAANYWMLKRRRVDEE